jgi:hypothetical protein
MATNLGINDKLVVEAQKRGKHKSKKDAVNAALGEYIRLKKQEDLFNLFGKIDFDPAYDYKAERRRKRA